MSLDEIESGITDFLSMISRLYENIEISSPAFVIISLLNAKGKKCFRNRKLPYVSINEIDRDHLLFPEVLVEMNEEEIEKKAEDIFLPIWHSFGLTKRL